MSCKLIRQGSPDSYIYMQITLVIIIAFVSYLASFNLQHNNYSLSLSLYTTTHLRRCQELIVYRPYNGHIELYTGRATAAQRLYEGRIKATAILPFCHKSLHSSCATEINTSRKRKRKPHSHHDEFIATVRLQISRKE